MAQRSGFFTAQQNPDGSYDRVYTAEEFAFYFSKFIGNGVFITPATQLQVSQSSDIDMSVNVSAGDAYINGWWYNNTNVVNLRVSAANGFNGRIDLVVLRWSKLTRDITLAIVEGEPAPVPIAPQLTRNEDIYELCLARINVGATDTVISNAVIQDTRSDRALCGFVHGVVDQIDATNLFQQFQANFDIWYNNLLQYSKTAETSFDEFMENSANEFREMLENDESRFSALLSTNQEAFTTWFNNVKEQLSESVAGKLQLEIEELQRKEEVYEDTWMQKSASDEPYKEHTFVKHNNKLWVSIRSTKQEPTDSSTDWLFLAVCKLTPVTRSNVITSTGQQAVDAVELNPNVSGTLRSDINAVKSSVNVVEQSPFSKMTSQYFIKEITQCTYEEGYIIFNPEIYFEDYKWLIVEINIFYSYGGTGYECGCGTKLIENPPVESSSYMLLKLAECISNGQEANIYWHSKTFYETNKIGKIVMSNRDSSLVTQGYKSIKIWGERK